MAFCRGCDNTKWACIICTLAKFRCSCKQQESVLVICSDCDGTQKTSKVANSVIDPTKTKLQEALRVGEPEYYEEKEPKHRKSRAKKKPA